MWPIGTWTIGMWPSGMWPGYEDDFDFDVPYGVISSRAWILEP